MTYKEIINKYSGNWLLISRHKCLPEEFIEKHSDKVDWYYISKFQKLSEKFVKKYFSKIYFNYVPLCYFGDINFPKSWKTFL